MFSVPFLYHLIVMFSLSVLSSSVIVAKQFRFWFVWFVPSVEFMFVEGFVGAVFVIVSVLEFVKLLHSVPSFTLIENIHSSPFVVFSGVMLVRIGF